MKKIIILILFISIGTANAKAGTISNVFIKETTKEITKETVSKLAKDEEIDEVEIAKDAVIAVVAEGCTATALTSVAVSTAGAIGATASTGTAIATLSGAAATSATLGAIGTSVAGAVGVTVAAPAVLGGTIIAVTAGAIYAGVDYLLFSDD